MLPYSKVVHQSDKIEYVALCYANPTIFPMLVDICKQMILCSYKYIDGNCLLSIDTDKKASQLTKDVEKLQQELEESHQIKTALQDKVNVRITKL